MNPKNQQQSSTSSHHKDRPVVYLCVECDGPAIVGKDGVFRLCNHDGAGIKAMLSATATGEAKVAS